MAPNTISNGEDVSITLSTTRLPLFAAGMVSCATATLLTDLSMKFFQLATQNPSNRSCKPACNGYCCYFRDTAASKMSSLPQTCISKPESSSTMRVLKQDPDPVELTEELFDSTNLVLKPSSPLMDKGNTNAINEDLSQTTSGLEYLPTSTDNGDDRQSSGNVCNASSTTPSGSTLTTPPETTTRNLHKCTYPGCGRLLTRAIYLKTHMRIHTGERPFVCDHSACGRKFQTAESLRHHQQLHLDKSLRQWQRCPYPGCDVSKFTRSKLRQHMKIHSTERPFTCDVSNCGRKFKFHQELKSHKITHLDKSARQSYTCAHPGCGMKFLTSSGLAEHRIKHLEEKPVLKCDQPGCERRFTSFSGLRRHRQFHGSPFSCPQFGCHRVFRYQSSLRNHLNTHSKAQVFVCNYSGCGRTFWHRKSFHTHKRSHISKTGAESIRVISPLEFSNHVADERP